MGSTWVRRASRVAREVHSNAAIVKEMTMPTTRTLKANRDRSRPARGSSALVAVVALLVGASGCSSRSKDIAAAKKDVEAELDGRAATAASAAVKQALAEDQKNRDERARRVAEARRAEHDDVVKRPEAFLSASNLQTSRKAAGTLQLTSMSLTNTSKYPMTDVRGTLDLHGTTADAGTTSDVISSVPVELAGAIAPGASMVFTSDAHSLVGGAAPVSGTVDRVTFTVTGVKSVGAGARDDDTQDGGL
jgi:hypothetical protein